MIRFKSLFLVSLNDIDWLIDYMAIQIINMDLFYAILGTSRDRMFTHYNTFQ